MRALAPLAIAALIACGVAQASERTTQSEIARGRVLVEQNCGSCHAIAARGASPAANAPAFRVIAQNYPVAHLEEALAEGIDVGDAHTIVAERSFEPTEIDAIVAYLESIQTPRQTPRAPRANTAAVG